MYVAGLERGVLPIGLWFISIILSIFSYPCISLCLPTGFLLLFIILFNPLYNISLTRVLFPDPDTPVTILKVPSGIEIFIFFKLFSFAPITLLDYHFPYVSLLGP